MLVIGASRLADTALTSEFAQEALRVLEPRVRTLSIRESLTGRSPCKSAERSSTQLHTREPNHGSGKDGRELKKSGGLDMFQPMADRRQGQWL